MVRAIFIFLFSLIIFPYNGHADSVMSSDENSSYFSYLGFNFIGTRFLKGHRLAFEAGLPVYQSTDVDMKQSYVVQLGWQKAF